MFDSETLIDLSHRFEMTINWFIIDYSQLSTQQFELH
jgi:hypothetical protein